MNVITIEGKFYVVLPENSYHAVQKAAALKASMQKTLTIEEARARSKRLIKIWASEKV